MKKIRISGMLLLTASWLIASGSSFAAAPSAALVKAKQDAEAKGYLFEASHDDIVAKAKKEGKLRVMSTMETAVIKAMREGFKKKYPFIDLQIQELGSVDENQRFLLEIKAGVVKNWDVNRAYTDFYDQYFPYQKKIDILGMAEQKVLNIPPKLVDPQQRNLIAVASNITVVAFNKKLISAEKVPDHWEDFLKPEFKGKKFVLDIRPLPLGMLVPAWGLEKTVDFAKKLNAQQPVWGRGHTRVMASLQAGEYPLFLGPNFGAVKRTQMKDPTGVIGYKIPEPIPVRLHEANGVLANAEYPYAALLWLEYQASPEGQKIMDDRWPFGASLFAPGSAQEEVTRGKKVSLIDWSHYTKLDDYINKAVEAMGFPTATVK
ncbi:MAG TPA: extracellular solute-binding protein [Candidatus Limnocylindrales bacterium]|nr:extracellular solute-binding protein [Candidatus Limnocylindrales bacterium]